MEGSIQGIKGPPRTAEMVSLFGEKKKAWIIYSTEFLQHIIDWPSLLGSLSPEPLPLACYSESFVINSSVLLDYIQTA